ncbi:Uncharacterised protein [Mycobacterium tuberculosis]|nr:Uncharacterised protein [Mycobacterium tuberculosis]
MIRPLPTVYVSVCALLTDNQDRVLWSSPITSLTGRSPAASSTLVNKMPVSTAARIPTARRARRQRQTIYLPALH